MDPREDLQRYSLGDIVEIKRFNSGLANESYKVVTDKDAYVLTYAHEKSGDQIEQLTEALNLMVSFGVPCNKVLPDNSGNLCSLGKNQVPLYVKSYLVGECPEAPCTKEQLSQIGKAMGKLHTLESVPQVNSSFAYGIQFFSDSESWDECHLEFKEWLLRFKNKFLFLTANLNLPQCFIHGDLFCDNLLFYNGEIAAILDFEELCHGPRVFDLGMAFVGLLQNVSTDSIADFSCFLKGYSMSITLEEQELMLLKTYAEYAACCTALWRYKTFNVTQNNHPNAHLYKQMMELCDKLQDYSASQFLKLIIS
jgi:homoserine kinase type II